MKKFNVVCVLVACVIGLSRNSASAQILISGGAYNQNFNSLATSGTANAWANNVTLAGWYASKNTTNATTYRASDGTSTTGDTYSYGVAGVNTLTDRALGSLASGPATPLAFGVRFVNDTATAQTNITVSYTGEQWRSGTTTDAQALAFSYQVGSSPITNTYSASGWTSFSALNFVSPNLSGLTNAVDGNAASNRQVFANVVLTGVVVQPGQELFLRWQDSDDTGFDNGLAIDDLTVTFNTSNAPAPPTITTQPQSQTVTAGDTATFTVVAGGTSLLRYQWNFQGTNLAGATNDTLVIFSVTTNQAGPYFVTVSNAFGTTNSQTATLTVTPPSTNSTVSLMTYNVKGNGTTNWSTNTAQVQAIGRQLMYLKPDIIAFNEIPYTNTWQMTNWITAFLPGYSLATNSGTDGFIRSVIASRFPITRSTKWLDGANLNPFGYTNTSSANADNFTRDLFEAQISVPGFSRPLHVFTTHLKSSAGTNYADNLAKRAAEAAAITNFFATNFFVLYPYDPYTLSGDMNESDTNELSIQRLLSPATGLRLTNPSNPITGSINTYSTTTANPSERIDYIFPCGLLFSNIRTSQVFRTDRLNPVPPNLFSNDCKVASDHLPVLMVFNSPYDKPFRLTSITRTNPGVTLQWQSVFGQPYRVEVSSNLTAWNVLANNLTATGSVFTLTTNVTGDPRFFRVYRAP